MSLSHLVDYQIVTQRGFPVKIVGRRASINALYVQLEQAANSCATHLRINGRVGIDSGMVGPMLLDLVRTELTDPDVAALPGVAAAGAQLGGMEDLAANVDVYLAALHTILSDHHAVSGPLRPVLHDGDTPQSMPGLEGQVSGHVYTPDSLATQNQRDNLRQFGAEQAGLKGIVGDKAPGDWYTGLEMLGGVAAAVAGTVLTAGVGAAITGGSIAAAAFAGFSGYIGKGVAGAIGSGGSQDTGVLPDTFDRATTRSVTAAVFPGVVVAHKLGAGNVVGGFSLVPGTVLPSASARRRALLLLGLV